MASRSISELTVYERLYGIARELEYAAALAAKALNGGSVREVYEEVRKSSQSAQNLYFSLLNYLADGRMALIENVTLYIRAAMAMFRAAQKVEASLFRVLLLEEAGSASRPQELSALARVASEAAGNLSSQVNLASTEEGWPAARAKFGEIVRLEDEADRIYREGLRKLLSAGSAGPVEAIILKDAMEFLEECVDEILEAASYINVTKP